MSNIRESIQEKQAERKLNILKSFSDLDTVFEKGHMDFDSSNAPKGKSNLTKKTITDKNGHQTTKWVKQGEDDTKKQDGKSDTSGHYTKDERDALNKLEEHASSTSTEDLKAFLKKYGNDSTKIDEVEAARIELEDRGELEDEEDGEGANPKKYKDWDENTPKEDLEKFLELNSNNDDFEEAKKKANQLLGKDESSDLKITDEDGNDVNEDFLKEMLELSKDRGDFLNKVNNGITNEESSVSHENDSAILKWYDDNSDLKKQLDLQSKLEKVTKSVENLKKHLTSKE